MASEQNYLKPVNIERLQKMSAFLRQIKPELFNFGVLRNSGDSGVSCGTVGCAIGWSDQVFPDAIELGKDHPRYPKLKPEILEKEKDFFRSMIVDLDDTLEVISTWLIGDVKRPDEYLTSFVRSRYFWFHLFVPCNAHRTDDRIPSCDKHASAVEVADMIDKFIDLYSPPNNLQQLQSSSVDNSPTEQ